MFVFLSLIISITSSLGLCMAEFADHMLRRTGCTGKNTGNSGVTVSVSLLETYCWVVLGTQMIAAGLRGVMDNEHMA